ncbi:hypothetical protein NDI37_26640 [Funiculus sociatus GB2-A5]|uniref:Uncharacterized protein n=1 Tax=Funiculus sociatus GB2-A5 TaxID=2933946 RepID=A0ABV0JX43_9CYAN|nr:MULTISPECIES: hypothetical protein [unclassified Trichocoleus]MBD1907395.1 hypothetical protein [Trichocoleus sp. FACHB-832]MBD2063733.1 hypothetical protein [Trichocoleus sp. FACHB-6]
METVLAYAQQLVYTLLTLMPSQYQRDNLEAILGLFLEAQGHPLPEHSKTKPASALSRFLNIYSWSTRKLIYITRNYVLKKILSHCPQGCQVDVTSHHRPDNPGKNAANSKPLSI